MPHTSNRVTVVKRIASLACFILLAALSACGSGTTNPSSPGTNRTTLIASGHPEWPPIMYRSGAIIEGAGPALVKKIFDDLGITVEFPQAGTWDEVQAKARTGEVDLLVAAYKTTERERYMVYSDPYTTDPVSIFVARGKAFPFDGWDALLSKKGIAMVGDSYGQAFDAFADARLQLRRVTTSAEAFALVSSGQADYLLYSLYAGNDHLKKTGTGSQFERLPKAVNEENFYITISRKSPYVTYLPLLNQRLARYKADGTIAALIAQYANR
jgi:polar amino acid transport system substrate-binding protein